MRTEKITRCLTIYTLHDNTRVKSFRSEEQMDRWVTKFKRENEEYGYGHIKCKIVGYKQLDVGADVIFTRFGE